MERLTRKEILVRPDSGTFATGTTGIVFKIPRRQKRLKKITLRMNVTLGAGMVGGDNATDRLEGICSKIKFSISDQGNSVRDMISGCSAELLAFQRKMGPRQSRVQQTVLGASSAGTYDVLVELSCVHPDADYPMAYYQSIPFWSRNNDGIGLGDDATLTVDLAAINDNYLGLKTGTVTHNYQKLYLEWFEINDSDPLGRFYVPREVAFSTFTPSAGGTGQSFAFAKDGYMASILFQEFATYSSTQYLRGQVLTGDATPGVGVTNTGYYELFYRGVSIDTFDSLYELHDDELYCPSFPTDTAPGSTHNLDKRIWMKNFWKPALGGNPGTLASCPNLSTENKGDSLFLKPNDITASTTIRVLTDKFLVSNPNLLAGA